jgi:MFS family permease
MPVMARQAGIDDKNTQLMLTGIIAVISFIGAVIGSTLVDRVGRRKMLFGASCLFVFWFVIITILSSQFAGSGNKAGSNATIAMIYLFGFTFSVAFTPFQALYPVECLNFETRAKGMAVYNFWVNVAGFFNQYVTPIGLGDVAWKFYFLYIGWDAFQAAFIYFFYVETKDRTLEVSFRHRLPGKGHMLTIPAGALRDLRCPQPQEGVAPENQGCDRWRARRHRCFGRGGCLNPPVAFFPIGPKLARNATSGGRKRDGFLYQFEHVFPNEIWRVCGCYSI